MNRVKIGVLCLLICLTKVKCEPPPPNNQYGSPINNQYGTPINNYGAQQNYDNYNEHDHGDHGEPKSYEFGYQVKDDYSGNNYKRQEVSDGNQVQGEYRVQLPDGRLQIVTYYADWKSGFHADVRYEGEATYPETYGNNAHGGYQHGGGHNNYNQHQPQQGYNNAPATSQVSIKDYSGAATPYNAGGYNNNNYNNQNYQNGHGHNGYENHGTPNNAYGAPYK